MPKTLRRDQHEQLDALRSDIAFETCVVPCIDEHGRRQRDPEGERPLDRKTIRGVLIGRQDGQRWCAVELPDGSDRELVADAVLLKAKSATHTPAITSSQLRAEIEGLREELAAARADAERTRTLLESVGDGNRPSQRLKDPNATQRKSPERRSVEE